MARCAVRAAFSGARSDVNVTPFPFVPPADAGGDIAARCPYLRALFLRDLDAFALGSDASKIAIPRANALHSAP